MLKGIRNPEFLKTLSYEELDKLAIEIRETIINTLSEKGGHLSSNLGAVELTLALHRVFEKDDKILFDVGHQSYTHKILTGRYEEFVSTLREFDGLSGYQKRSESIYDCFEAGHAATSVSAAIGFAVGNRINNNDANVVAIIGDGAITSGMALEALNNLGGMKEDKVIVVLNDNEMAISKAVGGISQMFLKIRTNLALEKLKEKTKKIAYHIPFGKYVYNFFRGLKNIIRRVFVSNTLFENMNLKYIGPIDGHNIKKIEKTFKYAKICKESIVVHVVTKKGKGYNFAENDKLGEWHGVAPFKIDTGRQLNNEQQSWSQACSDIVYDLMAKDEKIIAMTPAMIEGSRLNNIANDFSNRFFDVGISEEHIFTFAAGLALAGAKPYISIYSTFMQRSYDQISHDLARMELNAVVGVDRSGLVGKDGETHQGTFDVAFIRTIPNTTIAMPKDVADAKSLYKYAFDSNKLVFIRYPRESVLFGEDSELRELKTSMWDYEVKNKNNDNVLIVTGPMYEKVKKSSENIEGLDLVFARFYHPFDDGIIKEVARNKKRVYIYDIYSDEKGFALPLVQALLVENKDLSIKAFAIPSIFIKQGTIEEQLKYLKLDLKTVIDTIKQDLKI